TQATEVAVSFMAELPVKGIGDEPSPKYEVEPVRDSGRTHHATSPATRARGSSASRHSRRPASGCDALTTSCFSRQTETARKTTSFIRNATLPCIAGKPAAASQPSGRDGMRVPGVTNVPTERTAPRTPALGFQNPQIRSAAVSHSDTPRK